MSWSGALQLRGTTCFPWMTQEIYTYNTIGNLLNKSGGGLWLL